jgi:hypothetical protein
MIIQKQFNNFDIRIDTLNETMNLYDIAFILGFTRQSKGKDYLRLPLLQKKLESLGIMQLTPSDNFTTELVEQTYKSIRHPIPFGIR